MRGLELEETGHGIYLVKGVPLPHHPSELAKGMIPGALENHVFEEVVAIVVGVSIAYDAWCAVEWERLRERLKERADENRYQARKSAIERLIEAGFLLRSRWRRGWRSFLDAFTPDAIYPAPCLIEMLFAHQQDFSKPTDNAA